MITVQAGLGKKQDPSLKNNQNKKRLGVWLKWASTHARAHTHTHTHGEDILSHTHTHTEKTFSHTHTHTHGVDILSH
jgi:hypothetical protein